MDGFENNSQCILEYLALFQALSEEEVDTEQCRRKWQTILEREQASDSVQLAPPFLRLQFQLEERDFLLAMAALALEMDGGLRNAFRRKYALALPTIEYGLQLISPLCPSSCETLAELAGNTMLCGMLLRRADRPPFGAASDFMPHRTGLSHRNVRGGDPRLHSPDGRRDAMAAAA